MEEQINSDWLHQHAATLADHLRGHTGLPTLEVYVTATWLVVSWPVRACWLSSMKRAVPEAYRHLVIYEPRD